MLELKRNQVVNSPFIPAASNGDFPARKLKTVPANAGKLINT